jgi:large subunit ribosomal protein L29
MKTKVKSTNFKDLSSDELVQKQKDIKKELFDLNYPRKMGRVEKPNRFSVLRRDIARILTILREREIDHERTKSK